MYFPKDVTYMNSINVIENDRITKNLEVRIKIWECTSFFLARKLFSIYFRLLSQVFT